MPETLNRSAFPKLCICCKREYSIPAWCDLDLVGYMGRRLEGVEARLELRRCPAPCNNTIAVPVVPPKQEEEPNV